MTLKIHPLSKEHFADWGRLWRNYQTFYRVALSGEVHTAAWRRLVDRLTPIHGALAFKDDRAIGLVHWFYHPSLWRENDVCYLQDLYVDRGQRVRGVGRALIDHVYTHAENNRAPEVYWHTHKSNETAMRLYDRIAEASGFVQYKKTFTAHALLEDECGR